VTGDDRLEAERRYLQQVAENIQGMSVDTIAYLIIGGTEFLLRDMERRLDTALRDKWPWVGEDSN
jgi:hypothetical protein